MKPIDYPFIITPLSEEDGGGFLISFPDLAGCISDGDTPQEAMQNGYDAAISWLETAKEFNDPIPYPSKWDRVPQPWNGLSHDLQELSDALVAVKTELDVATGKEKLTDWESFEAELNAVPA